MELFLNKLLLKIYKKLQHETLNYIKYNLKTILQSSSTGETSSSSSSSPPDGTVSSVNSISSI